MNKFGFKDITSQNWLEPDEIMNHFLKSNSNGDFKETLVRTGLNKFLGQN